MSDEKAKIPESAGDESGEAVGPYGTAATWSLARLPFLTVRLMADHTAFFGFMIVADGLVSLLPGSSAFLSLIITLCVISGTLRAIDSEESLGHTDVWKRVQDRAATLIGAQLLVFMILGLLAAILWFLVAQVDAIRLGGPDTILWMIVFGPPIAFALSLPFFLAVAVLDGKEGGFRSLLHAVRLYLGFLPGNLVIALGIALTVFSGALGLALVLPEPAATIAGALWTAVFGTVANVLASLRWRQLRALEA